MTGRDWQPGEVLVSNGVRGIVTATGADDEVAGWVEFSDGKCLRLGGLPDSARPLVVIDLSNQPVKGDPPRRTEAQMLVDMLRETAENFFTADAAALAQKVADQIASQINQPKPEEPTDPAARVKTSNGVEWAKVGPWWVCPDLGEVPRDWDYLVDLLDDSEATS